MTNIFATVYQQHENSYFPTVEMPPNYKKSLPIGTYVVNYDMKMGFYVTQIKDFDLPKKVYGSIHGRAERIINTFNERPNSTGIILSGEKGSGKTLLAKKLGIDLQKQGVITLIVNQAYTGDAFNSFIQSISQPAYVLFDEYEKVYNKEELQNALLTLFDGVYPSKKLFAVTSNERGRMNSYMINRPGRFFYAFEYKGLGEDEVREYLEDNLLNKDHIESFVRYASTYEAFNFDMLSALTEEMNRYGEPVTEAAKWVNVAQSWTTRRQYDLVKATWKQNEPVGFKKFLKEVSSGGSFNPFVNSLYVIFEFEDTDEEDGSKYDDSESITFEAHNMVKFEGKKFIYENEDLHIEIVEHETERFDPNNLVY